jgi:hypothetical protein
MSEEMHLPISPIISKFAKTTDQIINDPNIYVENFPLDPWTPVIKTNNFMQQTLSRNLAFDDVDMRWTRLIANKYSYLVTGKKTVELYSFDDVTVTTASPKGVYLKDLEYEEITINSKSNGLGFVWVAGSQTGAVDDYVYIGSMNFAGNELGKCLVIRQQFKYLQISWNSITANRVWSGWIEAR